MRITLAKNGTKKRTVEVSEIVIPDLWHIAMSLPEHHKNEILQTWHLAHDLKTALMDQSDLLATVKAIDVWLMAPDMGTQTLIEMQNKTREAIAQAEGRQ